MFITFHTLFLFCNFRCLVRNPVDIRKYRQRKCCFVAEYFKSS